MPLLPGDSVTFLFSVQQAAEAIGCISAALVCPYPPGIPLLVPGEEITAGVLDLLNQFQAAGSTITGFADSEEEMLQVMD